MQKRQQQKRKQQPKKQTTTASTSTDVPGYNLTVMPKRGGRSGDPVDPSRISLTDSTYELIIMFDLDDPRLTTRLRALLFQALKRMMHPEHDRDRICNLDRLLTYYNTPTNSRKPLQPKHASLAGYIRATHILLYWDAISPEARRPLKDNPINVFQVPCFDKGLECFMLYERAHNYVHVLNWNVRHDSQIDHCTHLVDTINYLKRRYLDPRHDVQFLRLDIQPLLNTLALFGVALNFEVNYSDLVVNVPDGDVCLELALDFRHVMRDPSRRDLRRVLRDTRYRTKLPNGDRVIRLYYYPTLCSCALKVDSIQETRAGHCAECGEIYYCTESCKQWLRCCASSSSSDDDEPVSCKK